MSVHGAVIVANSSKLKCSLAILRSEINIFNIKKRLLTLFFVLPEFKEKPLDSLPVSSLNFNSTFEKCRQREIRILSRPTPRNFLEEMASWTDNGVMWHFPINNEQGIEEKDVSSGGSSFAADFPLLFVFPILDRGK